MKSRRLLIVFGVLVVALAIGLEVASRYWGSGAACVVIVNEGAEPMQGVVASYAGTRMSLGMLEPGERGKVWFSGAGRGALRLDFTQKGNPLSGFKLDDYDPMEHRRDATQLALVVKNGQVERFVEEDASVKSPPRMLDRLLEWIRDGLH
jgi:hypothetical protein